DYDFEQLAHPWSGKVRDVRLWNVARAVSDIQADMNSTLTGNEPGLLGNWRLGEGSGVVGLDATPNHNDALLGGSLASQPTPVGTQVQPPVTTALFFNGVDNNVQIADSPTLRPTSALSIQAWVNTGDNFTANGRHIFAKTVGTGVQDSYVIWYANGQLHAFVGNASTATTALNYTWNPVQNTWYRVAFTYDSTGPKLYIDGTLVAS